jgi:hypothetical protein
MSLYDRQVVIYEKLLSDEPWDTFCGFFKRALTTNDLHSVYIQACLTSSEIGHMKNTFKKTNCQKCIQIGCFEAFKMNTLPLKLKNMVADKVWSRLICLHWR